MGLIDLKTNLKSLKFGQDQLGGGSSNQPYVVTPIPSAVPPSSPDFVLRGGSLLPKDIANDETRLGKFFLSTEGVLFTVKQNLLSRTAVRTQASTGLLNEGVYTPISTLIEAGGVAFGLHVNKQGLNPIPGALGSLTTYSDIVTYNQSNENNRLVNLFGAKIIYPSSQVPDLRFLKDNINANPQSLLLYKGGPGSILGIGPTQIRLTNPTDKNFLGNALNNSTINYLTYSVRALNTATVPTQITENLAITTNKYELNNYRNVKNYIPALHQIDFRSTLIQAIKDNGGVTTLMSDAPSYEPSKNKTLEQRTNLGDPGNANGKNLISYTNGNYGGAASINSYDKINASALYQSGGPKGTNNPNPDAVNNDLVKFRIGVINNNDPSQKTYIHFRAFLNQISDAYTAEWNSTRYIGRGENFYTYGGFDRKVSLSWTVAAQSKIELIPMYKKLNYLASIITPDYSQFGYMRGNIVTLTIGGYFYEQPGIITGLDYTMNEENDSWEIGIDDEGASDPSVKELPHIIRVTGFNFIPIHTFVPRLQRNTYNSDGDLLNDINTYGQERYIALSAGSNTNYE